MNANQRKPYWGMLYEVNIGSIAKPPCEDWEISVVTGFTYKNAKQTVDNYNKGINKNVQNAKLIYVVPNDGPVV